MILKEKYKCATERNFYIDFPLPLLPSLNDPGAMICAANKSSIKELINAKADKIVIWNDINLARTWNEQAELQGKICVALPLNIDNAPYNYEYIQYNISKPFTDGIQEAENSERSGYIRQLERLAAIYNLTLGFLRSKKYIKNPKILLLLDGDESAEEEASITARIRRENTRKKILTVRIGSSEFAALLKKSSKFFPYYTIFEYEKVYTVKSVAALYLSIFCASVDYNGIHMEKASLFNGEASVAVRNMVVEFYFSICRNSFLDNPDSLLTDIMDPFSRLLMAHTPMHVRVRKIVERLDGLLKKKLKLSVLHGWYTKRRHGKSILGFLNGPDSRKPASPEESRKFFSNIDSLKEREELLAQYIRNGSHDLALALGQQMLEDGQINQRMLRMLISASFSLGNFQAGLLFSRLGEALYPALNNGEFEFMALRFLLLQNLSVEALCQLVKYAFAVNKAGLNLSRFRLDHKLSIFLGDFNWQLVLSLLKLRRIRKNSLQKANLLFAIQHYREAAEVLETLSGQVAATRLFSYYTDTSQCDDAKRVLETRINNHGENHELAYALHIAACDRENIRNFLSDPAKVALIKNYGMRYLGHMLLGEICLGFKVFAKSSHFHLLDKYFSDNLVSTLFSDMNRADKAVVFSECFIGDELRYSRMYPAIAEKMNADECVFTCDRRLEPILSRTFPELTFHALNKTREVDLAEDINVYKGLPGMELARFMDAEAWVKFRDYERVCTVMAGLTGTIRSYESLKNLRHLKYDQRLRDAFRERLQKARDSHGKRFIGGLSWRSNISDPKRDRLALTRELVETLLEQPDVLWVSAQYDGLKPREKDYFKRFDNFVILDDVDMFNDIEAAAALYGALDIMISAPTFSADLAAAVGTPTIAPMPGNVFSVFCRPGTNKAIFDINYEYMNCRQPSGINALVKRVYERLQMR